VTSSSDPLDRKERKNDWRLALMLGAMLGGRKVFFSIFFWDTPGLGHAAYRGTLTVRGPHHNARPHPAGRPWGPPMAIGIGRCRPSTTRTYDPPTRPDHVHTRPQPEQRHHLTGSGCAELRAPAQHGRPDQCRGLLHRRGARNTHRSTCDTFLHHEHAPAAGRED